MINAVNSLICLVSLSLLLSGCITDEEGAAVEKVSLFTYEVKELADIDIISDTVKTIELKSADLSVPANPEKCIFAGSRIFVLDKRTMGASELLIFDSLGNCLGRIGAVGRGPGEYLNISDFAIAPGGGIWIEDPVANRLIKYRSDLSYDEALSTDFDMECMAFLDDGRMLLGIPPWESEKMQIAVTDTLLKVEKVSLMYSEYVDPSITFGRPRFYRNDNVFYYSRPLDDNIYVCDDKGSLVKIYALDFGQKSFSDEERLGAGAIFDSGEYREYTALYRFGIAGDRYVIGSMLDNGTFIDFVADRNAEILYKGDISDYGNIIGYDNGWLISKVIPEKEDEHYKIELRKITL